MFRPLFVYIGLRYTAAKRKNNFISFISVTSIGGIALGIMTMIVVLSVMNGFQKEIRERSLSMAYHNKIVLQAGNMNDWSSVYANVADLPNVEAGAPFINGQGLLTANGVMSPVQVHGIDPVYESRVSALKNGAREDGDYCGRKAAGFNFSVLKGNEFGIALGTSLMDKLGVNIGDYVSLITSDINVTLAGVMPRVKRMQVIDAFCIGMYEYDSANALVHIKDAGKLFRVPEGEVQGVRLKLKDPVKARDTAYQVAGLMPDENHLVYSWVDEFSELFKMIEIEKLSMFVIMSLIVAVAVFNVVSTLVMVVTDKRSEIAILRTLGMTPKEIMLIFMVQGVVIGFCGVILGIIFGLLISFNVNSIIKTIESLLGKTVFEPSVYPISEIPSAVVWSDVLSVSAVAFLLATFATLYPAWKAARTQPAEALRYD